MIPFRRYVDITSGVGGGAGVRLRDLILRMFSANELVPPGSQIEFADADAVGAYFGTASEEYKRAAFYFGFISKNITKPNKLSIARWVNAAIVPKIFGSKSAKLLATYTAVANGALVLTLGAQTANVAAVNLTGSASLAAVAATLQAAIRAQAGTQFAAATVAYDATTNRFNFAGSDAVGAAIVVGVPGAGTDLAPLLGWTAASGAILANGSGVETLSACLAASAELSNNFGSFVFLPALTANEVAEAALWNDTQNNAFMFLHRVTAADAAATAAAVQGLSGCGLTLSPLATEYPAMLPGMVLAATDYTRRNATQNYMYQQATLTPSVLTAALADTYDALRVNYYGRTQAAGQLIDFYQRGTLSGLATDAVDMNVYANEIWLKDAAGAAILALLLSLAKVSANTTGRAQLVATLSTVIARAVSNGVISVGKNLSIVQKLYVGQITGDELAWQQVQNLGYWLDCVMQAYVTGDGRTEYKAVYTLVYGKDDTIRKVEGSHVLI
jgi:hypothetical protein